MKGFTIKCNECGKETTFSKKDVDYGELMRDNNNINIYGGYGGEVNICCDCGNQVEE